VNCRLITWDSSPLDPVVRLINVVHTHIPFCLKLKLSHYTPSRGLRGEQYSSYSYLTSALDWSEWSASRPGRSLALGKGHRYPLDIRLCGPRAGWRKILLLLTGIEPRCYLKTHFNITLPYGKWLLTSGFTTDVLY
jgi:hypothetical protein